MLLVGVGGSGKKSLCSLSSIITNSKYQTIQIYKKYAKKDFKKDLSEILI